MDVKEIKRLFENCECKKEHTCPIDAVVIDKDALCRLKQMCEDYSSVLLVSDDNTYEVCGKDVSALLEGKVENNLIFNTGKKVLIPNERAIEFVENKITKQTDLIIGVGSGVINDLCKYVSFFHKLPYFIVATAPSMDGYASIGAAMILGGMKVTVNARPPKAIFADANVLRNTPMDMLKAGYGDIIGKFSCLNDWKLSALVNDEYYCEKIYNCTLKCVMDIKDEAKNILAREESAISKLMEALVMVGILMSFAGSSRPASGSEHHLSHFFEITGIIDNKEYFAHGIDVLYSTYYTQKVREELLKLKAPLQNKTISAIDFENKIKSIYSIISDEVIALQNKLGWYNNNKFDIYRKKWNEIQSILAGAPSSSEIKSYIESIGLDLEDFISMYGEEKISNALWFAKDLKDRYSVLWLNFELKY